jgi:hypothetical protein
LANNTGFLLMAGLGALLFLGRGGATETTDEDSRIPAFNLQSYVDSLFGDMATVPVQPPMQFFYPPSVVVTSSGVPAVVNTAPELITPTTKVQIGGAGGETIVASSLAIIRQEQLDKQRFQAAANVQTPKTEATRAFNRDEEARQRAFADKLIKAARDAQAKRNAEVVATTREQQENIAKGLNPDGSPRTLPAGMSVIGFDYGSGPPTINFDEDDGDWTYTTGVSAGQPIGSGPNLDVDFTPEYSETFVISGGMDSPTVYSEGGQPTGVAVHEITVAYDIGF